MLTKELLVYSTRTGRVYPRQLRGDVREGPLAEALVDRITGAEGEPRGTLEGDLAALAKGHPRPKIAKGLVKLLLDRAEFEEPDPAAMSQRAEWLAEAEAVRRRMVPHASFEAYEAALAERLDLGDVRARLFQDLPEHRPMTRFRPIDAPGLLARYDLAQVQGLLLYAERLALRLDGGDTPELRRVLRWMRFNRLVADVQRDEGGWSMTVEGPGAVLEGAKKYGLQLASFFAVVPTVAEWSLEAEIRMPRRPTWVLALSHASGLKPLFEGGAGYVPPEMRRVVDEWRDPDWRLDPTPPPLPVGVNGWCVPDLAAHRGEHAVAIELFHAWHHGALPRRVAELAARPVSSLLLGVDRKLARKAAVDASGPQVFEFSGFPTARGLRRALSDWWQASGA